MQNLPPKNNEDVSTAKTIHVSFSKILIFIGSTLFILVICFFLGQLSIGIIEKLPGTFTKVAFFWGEFFLFLWLASKLSRWVETRYGISLYEKPAKTLLAAAEEDSEQPIVAPIIQEDVPDTETKQIQKKVQKVEKVHPHKPAKIPWGPVLVVLSLVFVVAALEGGTRLYKAIRHLPEHGEWFRSAESPAMAAYDFADDASYYVESRENLQVEKLEGNAFIQPVDYKGLYFNITDGKRVTIDQPEEYDHTIYIVGGSTVYGMYLPDEYTIPSYLQTMLNTEAGKKYKVENIGVISVNSWQELARIKALPIQDGDIVVLYNGVNDSFGIYDYCSKWQIENGYCPKEMPPLHPATAAFAEKYNEIITGLQNKSAFIYFTLAAHNFPPPHYKDNELMVSLARGIGEGYLTAIEETNRVVTEKGGVFLHFLQPTIFSAVEKTSYEQRIKAMPELVPAGLETSVSLCYVEFIKDVKLASKNGINSFDFTKTFDPANRPEGEEYFLDWDHINPRGNEIIAIQIMQILREFLAQ